ncbi:MAG: hypothetical protein IH921_12030 [Gemmatimonadetes bacterium]|nr:hypothetical protein [Gemmatimonadota bacterium]
MDPTRWTFGPWTPTLTTAALEAGGTPRAFPEPGEAIDPEWRLYGRASGDDKAPLYRGVRFALGYRALWLNLTTELKKTLNGTVSRAEDAYQGGDDGKAAAPHAA